MNLQDEIKALKERIAELEEQAKEEQEFPKDYDEYWYIDSDGDILNDEWGGFASEEGMLEISNVFQTKDEAEFALEKLKVEAELRKFSRPFKCEGINQYIFLNTDSGCIDVENRYYFPTQGTIYFESEEKAQEAVQSVGKERIKKYLFGVEDYYG